MMRQKISSAIIKFNFFHIHSNVMIAAPFKLKFRAGE